MPKFPDKDSDAAMQDSDAYLAKKHFFDQLLTIYGRKPVLEALQAPGIEPYRLHLARSNRPAPLLAEIVALAEQRGAEVVYHNRQSLARISKNSKQDQGVAVDIHCQGYQPYRHFLENLPVRPIGRAAPGQAGGPRKKESFGGKPSDNSTLRVLALCNIHNPQNLGMIIRSACAGGIDGILIPSKGCAPLSPLVIKASAGTLFKAPVITCQTLKEALPAFKGAGFSVCVLSSHATESLFEHRPEAAVVYVLGNESEGVSRDVFNLADTQLMIPMGNAVESLNVAVTAALIAFSKSL